MTIPQPEDSVKINYVEELFILLCFLGKEFHYITLKVSINYFDIFVPLISSSIFKEIQLHN